MITSTCHSAMVVSQLHSFDGFRWEQNEPSFFLHELQPLHPRLIRRQTATMHTSVWGKRIDFKISKVSQALQEKHVCSVQRSSGGNKDISPPQNTGCVHRQLQLNPEPWGRTEYSGFPGPRVTCLEPGRPAEPEAYLYLLCGVWGC